MSEQEANSTEDKKPLNPLLAETRLEAERLERAKEEAKLQADRLQELQSNQMLGSSAGLKPADSPEKTEQEKAKELAKEFWKGTSIEKDLERANE